MVKYYVSTMVNFYCEVIFNLMVEMKKKPATAGLLV